MARKPLKPSDETPETPTQDEDWGEALPPPVPKQDPALAEVARRFGGFRPARQILTKVRSVPTIFPQLDWATKVNGLPLQRFIVVHGPSGMGKTELCLGLGLSFILRGHFFNLIDAEYTTPVTWLEQLMQAHADSPLFNAMRPTSYEETVDSVRQTLDVLSEAKEKGQIHRDTGALFVVDSLRKLVPRKLLDKIADGKGGIDGMDGRAAQIKAALNAAWLDELIPSLYHAGATMIVIARESENTDKAGMFDKDWKMTGGKAIEYDSSLIMRVNRWGWVKQGASDESETIGEKHAVTIRKTKIAGKDDKEIRFFFHSSNGKAFPPGFDRSRDIIELAVKFKVIQKNSGWYLCGPKRFNGINALVRELNDNPGYRDELEAQTRAAFRANDPYAVSIEDSE